VNILHPLRKFASGRSRKITALRGARYDDPLTRHRLFPFLLALLLAGCKPPELPRVTCIVGAVLFDGTGGPPISNSVVTIENGRIRAAGMRSNLTIPPEADKIDGSGKFIVPTPIDLDSRKPALPEAATLRDVRTQVDRGANGFLGIMRDTDSLDHAFVTRLRDLRIVFAPRLSAVKNPAELAIAEHNTKTLDAAGVPIAVAGALSRETELLVEAGLTPTDVLLAATRNGAQALGMLDQEGTLEPGKRANLMLLTANPAEDIRNLSKIDRTMQDGTWQQH